MWRATHTLGARPCSWTNVWWRMLYCLCTHFSTGALLFISLPDMLYVYCYMYVML